MRKLLFVMLYFVLFSANAALAANVLFVSDNLSDSTNIPSVLTGDGHTVTVVTNDYAGDTNPTLQGSLAAYGLVVWSATGTGSGSVHTTAAVFSNLASYVSAGGYVLVTGYDTIASPDDSNLLTFLGGTGVHDGGTPSGGAIGPNSLTSGVVNIVGVTPTGGYSDQDSMTGIAGDTVGVVPDSGDWLWTIRTLGSGQIAYISNGYSGGEHASWLDTSAGGAGAYNAGLRNFASNAGSGPGPASIPTLSEWGMIIMSILLGITAVVYIRRQRMEL